MKLKFRWGKALCVIIALIFCLQLASCGFILYPERRGQSHGRIDPAIAVLDGVGLLLFLVPGIIAFAVDFATGTIYLPGSRKASTTPSHGKAPTVIQVKSGDLDISMIEAVVSEHTGYPLSFDQENLRVYEWDGVEDIGEELVRLDELWKNAPLEDRVAHKTNF